MHADVHWIADSGATSHMSTQRQWFKTFEPHVVPIRVANNAIVYSKGIGLMVMEPLDESLDPVCLSRVLYVPTLQNNLFAVLHLVTSHRFQVEIEGTEMLFLRNGACILTATIRNKTAWLDMRTPNAPESALRGEDIWDRSLWHQRLGHISKDLLKQAIKGNVADGLVINNNAPLLLHCEPCIVGKHHADPFPKKALHRTTRLVPMSSGYWYWVTFIDNWSCYGWIYLLKRKSDVFEAFKAFKAFVELQYSVSIECLHNDQGGEYIGHIWDTYFAETGICHKHTMEGMSQQGGVVERCNHMLEEHVVTMLNGACLPTRFWGKALYTYSRLLNMIPSAAIPAGTTPFEMANKRKPDYSTLRVFGCCAWAHVRHKKCRSLEPHAKPCVFLGIPDDFKGWKLWDPSAQGGRGGIIMSQDIIWNKSEFPGLSKEAHNPIPAHFGHTNVNKPLPDAPHFEEIDDCNEPEGAQLLPALIDVEDGLPPPDVEAPLPPLPDKSDNSNFENNVAPSTKTLLFLSSSSAASLPHMPLRSTTGTPVPSAPHLAQR
jgi:transposase InsO family protein